MTTAREAVEESGAMDDLFGFELATHIDADLASGKGRWVWDGDVDGVVGFQVRNSLGAWETVVVLYLEERDFESNSRYSDGVEL